MTDFILYVSTSVNKDAVQQNVTAFIVKWIMFWHSGSSHEALGMREGEGGHLEAMIKENSIKNIWNPNCLNTRRLQETEGGKHNLSVHIHMI